MRAREKKTRKEKIRILIATLAAISGCFLLWHAPIPWPQVLVYNRTPSLQTGWYLMLPAGEVKDGDIVGFAPPEDMKELATERGGLNPSAVLLKKVGAMPGEVYEIDAQQGFYANGKYIGQVHETDGEGRTLPNVGQGMHVVEPGRFLPVTEHPFSFDGRYYGTLDLSVIRFRAIRLDPFD